MTRWELKQWRAAIDRDDALEERVKKNNIFNRYASLAGLDETGVLGDCSLFPAYQCDFFGNRIDGEDLEELAWDELNPIDFRLDGYDPKRFTAKTITLRGRLMAKDQHYICLCCGRREWQTSRRFVLHHWSYGQGWSGVIMDRMAGAICFECHDDIKRIMNDLGHSTDSRKRDSYDIGSRMRFWSLLEGRNTSRDNPLWKYFLEIAEVSDLQRLEDADILYSMALKRQTKHYAKYFDNAYSSAYSMLQKLLGVEHGNATTATE